LRSEPCERNVIKKRGSGRLSPTTSGRGRGKRREKARNRKKKLRIILMVTIEPCKKPKETLFPLMTKERVRVKVMVLIESATKRDVLKDGL